MPREKKPFVIDMPAPRSSASMDATAVSARLQSITVGLLIAIVIASPLAFGTTEPWSQFIQRMTTLALFGLWIADQYVQRQIELSRNPIYLPAFLFVALVLVQLALGTTSYTYATLSEIPNLAVYGVLILIAGELLNRRRNLRTVVLSLSIFGFLLAVFAILQGFAGTSKVYGLRSTASLSAAIFGPYANHNHYAGLMEMLVPLSAAAALLECGAKRALLLFGTVIMALSIVFSRSRGGMLALACSVLFVCAMLLRRQRHRRGLLAMFGVLAVLVGLVLILGNDKIFTRLFEAQDQYRFSIYGDSIRMAMQKPILGHGLGTFPYVYPEFQSFWTNLLVNHAHDDYLELWAETGITGLALFAWMMLAAFRGGFSKLRDDKNDEGQLLTFAAMTSVVAMLVHSLLDFNLHIPANAALFFVQCSAAATPFKHRVRPLETESWAAISDDGFAGEP